MTSREQGKEKSQMVTPEQAELLARERLQAYLNACQLQSVEDAGNALMKMCSVAGLFMVMTVGQQEAVDRLYGTAAFIQKQKLPHFKMGRAS